MEKDQKIYKCFKLKKNKQIMKTFLVQHSHKEGVSNFLIKSNEELTSLVNDHLSPNKLDKAVIETLGIDYDEESTDVIEIEEIEAENIKELITP